MVEHCRQDAEDLEVRVSLVTVAPHLIDDSEHKDQAFQAERFGRNGDEGVVGQEQSCARGVASRRLRVNEYNISGPGFAIAKP